MNIATDSTLKSWVKQLFDLHGKIEAEEDEATRKELEEDFSTLAGMIHNRASRI